MSGPGTVVIGGTVVLQPVSILHGGLAVNVVSDFEVSQPGEFSSGTTQVTQQTRINAQDKPVNRIELKQGATVDDLVRSLQTIGATARDVISILRRPGRWKRRLRCYEDFTGGYEPGCGWK